MKYIFLDTNIFLHFKDFGQIDWPKLCNDDMCTIVISPIVIDELDKKKIGNTKIANRARKTLNKIEELFYKKKIKESILVEII